MTKKSDKKKMDATSAMNTQDTTETESTTVEPTKENEDNVASHETAATYSSESAYEDEETTETEQEIANGETDHPTEHVVEDIAPWRRIRRAPIMRHDVSIVSDDDIYLFNQGTQYRLYNHLGAHPKVVDGIEGTFFAVWAPEASRVTVTGDFNRWDTQSHLLKRRGNTGIWEGFIEGVTIGAIYKYHVESRLGGYEVDKADPLAFYAEIPPHTASVVWDLNYAWNDDAWMEKRRSLQTLHSPMSIYEFHIGSWKRIPEDRHRSMTYRELAPELATYITEMGFTHVEFMPVMEHPFYGSWGYQLVGYYAPSSRYGTPQDFMYLIDYLHQHDIGVILDWVPSHFAIDMHGLSFFDGSHLYEHASPQKGWHPDWNSFIFNHGRHEVQSFLISNAIYWLDKYHIDGLRVDAVASMLYLDYSRRQGEWIPNKYGGRDNLEAIDFLRRFNEVVYFSYPDVQTIAEESTSWELVSRPSSIGGLGFGMKWDMGWMHDTLKYMSKDPVHRKYHHGQLTFRMVYAFSENFVLSLSHDEVVHGKGSLINKMSGDEWQKFANLRLLYSYMYALPAKKLIFMGCEFAQWREWNHDESLDWHLLQYEQHKGIQKLLQDLNRIYRQEPALYEFDCEPDGFEWVDCYDWENSIISFIRKGKTTNTIVLAVCNFTPVPRQSYLLGVPRGGYWKELINSDAEIYGGCGMDNSGGVHAKRRGQHGRPNSIAITLPPLAVVIFQNLSTTDMEEEEEDDTQLLEEEENDKTFIVERYVAPIDD